MATKAIMLLVIKDSWYEMILAIRSFVWETPRKFTVELPIDKADYPSCRL